MNRREAIERVALLVGGTVIGAEFFISGCKQPDAKRVNAWFDTGQVAFMNEVGDTILPATKTPGAKAAGVGSFMAMMVADCYTPAEQKTFMTAIANIDAESMKMFNKKFLDCDQGQRTAIITAIDHAQKLSAKGKPKPKTYPYQYFAMVKQLTLLGYFTSEIGCTQALRYVPVPGRFDGDYPYKKGDKGWALS